MIDIDKITIGELKQLFVVPSPTSQEILKIFYQKNPTALTTGTDDLDAIGDEYQYTALVYHAAKEILEDAGQSELAARTENRYEREMMILSAEEGINDNLSESIRVDEGMFT